jgi:hypothetical protein
MYNLEMTSPDFLWLLANTPKGKHFELIAWFASQKKDSPKPDESGSQTLRKAVRKKPYR